MGIINFILVVHPSLPVNDLPSLVAYLKENPDKANYGSAGTGSPMHLGPELFKSLTGVQANHVPYRGEAAGVNDMIGGRLTFMLSGTATVAPHIQSGAVRGIATPSPQRSLARAARFRPRSEAGHAAVADLFLHHAARPEGHAARRSSTGSIAKPTPRWRATK